MIVDPNLEICNKRLNKDSDNKKVLYPIEFLRINELTNELVPCFSSLTTKRLCWYLQIVYDT